LMRTRRRSKADEGEAQQQPQGYEEKSSHCGRSFRIRSGVAQPAANGEVVIPGNARKVAPEF
jgi:hypothetical protein